MFMPRHFEEDDRSEAVAMARSSGFGHLVVVGTDGLQSTPMPFLINDDATVLRGHLAKPNPILKAAPCDALFVIAVSDAYISPSWYPSKAEDGKVVPTWNYEVVHLHGRLAVHDQLWTERMVRDLTDHHEVGMPAPWSVDDAPPDHVAGLLRAIVGVSLEVTRVVAKRKLSQNKSSADLDGAIDGLLTGEQCGGHDVADAMRAQSPHEP